MNPVEYYQEHGKTLVRKTRKEEERNPFSTKRSDQIENHYLNNAATNPYSKMTGSEALDIIVRAGGVIKASIDRYDELFVVTVRFPGQNRTTVVGESYYDYVEAMKTAARKI